MFGILMRTLRIEHRIIYRLLFVLCGYILRIYISLVSLKRWQFLGLLNKSHILMLTILWHDYCFFRRCWGTSNSFSIWVTLMWIIDVFGLLNLYGYIVLYIGDYSPPDTRLILFIFFRRLRIFMKPAQITARGYHL